jgi:DNA-binding NtrC family response regulator
MGVTDSTLTLGDLSDQAAAEGSGPGVLLVSSAGTPLCDAVRVPAAGLLIGRKLGPVADARLSREHARVFAVDGRLMVEDLGSHNGTFVNGQRIETARPLDHPGVVRAGETILLGVAQIDPFLGARVTVADDLVIGPRMRDVLAAVERAAHAGSRLLITGETGSGKELVARGYHRSAAPRGPFVALNCAAIPATLAESLLFGSTRGAYSGASVDRAGQLSRADGGVLFLDEIAELDPQVQAKLLRVLETGEVLPLGSSRPSRVQVRVCSATNGDLRALAEQGKFRSDLYHRLAESTIHVPPLRERRMEIPFLVAKELEKVGSLHPHVLTVERLLLDNWPGNLRALVATVRGAAANAQAQHSEILLPEHLPVHWCEPPVLSGPGLLPVELSREGLVAELQRHGGNVTAAAQALGFHRTQLYRLLRRHGLRSGTPEQ